MTVVLDASAAFHLCADPDGPSALAALAPCAPALLWSEFSALVSRQRWRGQIPGDAAAQLLEIFLTSEISRVASDDLYREATDMAVRLGWAKTYDAEYVALAMRTACPLVTLDARLARTAGRVVTVLSPDEALA